MINIVEGSGLGW